MHYCNNKMAYVLSALPQQWPTAEPQPYVWTTTILQDLSGAYSVAPAIFC